MNTETTQIIRELALLGTPEKAAHLSRFFKTGKGQYGEGDLFIGVTVPQQRTIAKNHQSADTDTLHSLLTSSYHEHRLTALLILLLKFNTAKQEAEKHTYIDFYLVHYAHINNWDLVDLSCYKLLGEWLHRRDKTRLYEWAQTDHLWKQRIAIVTCMHFIRQREYSDFLAIADLLIHHPHDLIHKAVGWLLRETGKKDRKVLTTFLASRYRTMPRTMLRYAIEHFPPEERKKYLNAEI